MAEPLERDAGYVEACRVAAWAEHPTADSYWDAGARKFNWPGGWPEGVEPEGYVRRQIAAAASPPPPLPTPSPTGPVSPSVQRLRAMLR